MRFGEDIDFSIRLFKNGNKVCLFPSAWVYHKRRTDWHKFFRQVYNSGIARINLYKKYPDSLKLVHLLPAAFTLGVLFSWSEASSALGVYCRSDFSVCLSLRILRFRIKSIKIGFLSIIASLYPTVRIRLWIFRCCLEQIGSEERGVFSIPENVLQIKKTPKAIVMTTVFIPYEH